MTPIEKISRAAIGVSLSLFGIKKRYILIQILTCFNVSKYRFRICIYSL